MPKKLSDILLHLACGRLLGLTTVDATGELVSFRSGCRLYATYVTKMRDILRANRIHTVGTHKTRNQFPVGYMEVVCLPDQSNYDMINPQRVDGTTRSQNATKQYCRSDI